MEYTFSDTCKVIQGCCSTVLHADNITKKIDLSFLDPPFNQAKTYNAWDDNLPANTYWKWMQEICEIVFSLTSDGGAIYFMQREKNTEFVLRCLRNSGWTFQNLIIWKKKTSAVPGMKRYGKHYQIIAFATKGKTPRVFNRLRIDPPLPSDYKHNRENGMYVTDVWDDIRELTSGYFAGDEALRDNEGNRLHKQQSPIQLLLRIILSSTKPGDVVLDPFAGSGTTLVVSEQLDRESIGIELDEFNVNLIRDRLSEQRKSDDVSRYYPDYVCTQDLDAIWTEHSEKNKSTADNIPPNIPIEIDELWTAKQRACHAIHEISYRACYKPQLPAYFIKKYCKLQSVVYDPFMGRGTTLIEAQLHGHTAIGNDINPLSKILTSPRLNPPTLIDIKERLSTIELPDDAMIDPDLLVFFHKDTLREIYGWRTYFHREQLDSVDAWLQMVACSRLTGHSSGFFSVFTLPPNLATSVASQRKINEKRNQKPEYRDTKALIYRKSKQLLRQQLPNHFWRDDAVLLTQSAEHTPEIPDESVDLVVTSPPFLDIVDYEQDNWLRMWFCDIEIEPGKIWQIKSLKDWITRMTDVFVELKRILKSTGRIAFEVGEVHKGTVNLEESVATAALEAGLMPEELVINEQKFTKTANCWGVDNNKKGTNSNRIVILKKN